MDGSMFRPAVPADLQAIFAIYMDRMIVPFLSFDPMPSAEFGEKVFADMVKDVGFSVIEKNKQIVGFIRASRHPGRARHVAYLGSFALAPKYHGTGLAAAVVNETILRLTNEGVKRIELIVESDNPRAITFYEKLGFQIEGALKKFYKRSNEEDYIDDHIMALLIR